MTVDDLNRELQKARDGFMTDAGAYFRPGSSEPATEHDLTEIVRMVDTALSKFQEAIIKYEKNR